VHTLHRTLSAKNRSFTASSTRSSLDIEPTSLSLRMKRSRKGNQRGRQDWGRHVRQESLIKFNEFSNHRASRLQVSYFCIPFALELLKDFLKVGVGSSDLFVDKSCTLLQIAPDVAHWPPT
jgi:hypothetical protein